MEISFADHRLQQECESEMALRRAHGGDCARCVMARLADLEAASSLEEFRSLPGRCHELHGGRRGTYALELAAGKHLTLARAGGGRPGRIDWRQVDAVVILTIADDQQDPRAR